MIADTADCVGMVGDPWGQVAWVHLWRFAYTIEGNVIEAGFGGRSADVVCTLEGNSIKSSYGGILSETEMTME